MRLATRIRYGLARWLVKAGGFSVVPPWVTESFLRPTFRALTTEGYQKNAAVFACISALAFSFPEPPLLVYDGEGDDASVLPNHPLRRLLRRPNPLMGEAELMVATIVYTALGGNGYWHKVRGRSGRVVEIWPYHFGNMRAVPGGPTWVNGYEFDRGTGVWEPVPAEDVVHFKWPSPDPTQPWQAQPPLQAAARDVDTDNEVTRYLFALLKNDAIPRTVIRVPTERYLIDDEVRRMKEQWRERYGGDHKGDVAILEGGAEVSRLGLDLEELAFEALHRIPETRIAAAFRVPPIIAGLSAGLEKATFANYREARQAYTEDTLVPLWRIVASEVTADLLPEFGDAGEVRFATTRVAALQESQDSRWKRVTDAYTRGLIQRNEGRRALGYPDDPDGDTYATTVRAPGGTSGAGPQPSAAQPILGYHLELGAAEVGEARAQLGLPAGETETARLRRIDTALTVAARAVSFGVAPGDALQLVGLDLPVTSAEETPAGDEPKHREPPPMKVWGPPDIEAQITAAVAAYLADEYAKAADGARSTVGKADGDLIEQWGLDLGPGIRQVMSRFYPLTLERAYGDAMRQLDLERAFDLDNPRVQETLGELAALVQRVAETTRDEIRALVGRQAAEGWGPEELAREIARLGEVQHLARAEVIAVTETASAYSRGAILAYRDSGVVAVIEWLTAVDERVCPICAPLNGTIVALGAEFAPGIGFPPAHPRCRCALAGRV